MKFDHGYPSPENVFGRHLGRFTVAPPPSPTRKKSFRRPWSHPNAFDTNAQGVLCLNKVWSGRLLEVFVAFAFGKTAEVGWFRGPFGPVDVAGQWTATHIVRSHLRFLGMLGTKDLREVEVGVSSPPAQKRSMKNSRATTDLQSFAVGLLLFIVDVTKQSLRSFDPRRIDGSERHLWFDFDVAPEDNGYWAGLTTRPPAFCCTWAPALLGDRTHNLKPTGRSNTTSDLAGDRPRYQEKGTVPPSPKDLARRRAHQPKGVPRRDKGVTMPRAPKNSSNVAPAKIPAMSQVLSSTLHVCCRKTLGSNMGGPSNLGTPLHRTPSSRRDLLVHVLHGALEADGMPAHHTVDRLLDVALRIVVRLRTLVVDGEAFARRNDRLQLTELALWMRKDAFSDENYSQVLSPATVNFSVENVLGFW